MNHPATIAPNDTVREATSRMGAPKQFESQPSLAHSYFQMSLQVYGTKADGLRRLNAAVGRKYSFGHISRWERGDRQPDRATRVAMLKEVLPWTLIEQGMLGADAVKIMGKTLDKLAERLA